MFLRRRVPFLEARLRRRGEGWYRWRHGGEGGGGIEEGRIWMGNLRCLADRACPRNLFFPPAPLNKPLCEWFGLVTPDDFSMRTGENRDPWSEWEKKRLYIRRRKVAQTTEMLPQSQKKAFTHSPKCDAYRLCLGASHR